jgi:hypothetical protein
VKKLGPSDSDNEPSGNGMKRIRDGEMKIQKTRTGWGQWTKDRARRRESFGVSVEGQSTSGNSSLVKVGHLLACLYFDIGMRSLVSNVRKAALKVVTPFLGPHAS